MNYNLRKPCVNCPYRSDVHFMGLSADRVEQLANLDREFACHKTVDYSGDDGGRVKQKSEHCAGALILLEHMERPHQMMRICERIGMYDRTMLDMDSPVFQSADEMIEALSE